MEKRVLKFRAWNWNVINEEWEMLPWERINKNSMDFFAQPNLFGQYSPNNKPHEIMQFTGLTDKNGIDIYEGDIVRWDDMSEGSKWRVAVVEINPDIRFKIIKINCDFIQSAPEGYVFRFGNFAYKDTYNHLEIIGNIHQHKHLLS